MMRFSVLINALKRFISISTVIILFQFFLSVNSESQSVEKVVESNTLENSLKESEGLSSSLNDLNGPKSSPDKPKRSLADLNIENSLRLFLTKDKEDDGRYESTQDRAVTKGHYVNGKPIPLPDPELILASHDFANTKLGLANATLYSEQFLRTFSANISSLRNTDISSRNANISQDGMRKLQPWATCYGVSVHGWWATNSPRGGDQGYGDGRAMSIGEVKTGILVGEKYHYPVTGSENYYYPTEKSANGPLEEREPGIPSHALHFSRLLDPARWELQWKGPGRTAFSRDGDGRAALRSSVREFLVSEGMHFLGVPTTRALSLVKSKSLKIQRQWYPQSGFQTDNPSRASAIKSSNKPSSSLTRKLSDYLNVGGGDKDSGQNSGSADGNPTTNNADSPTYSDLTYKSNDNILLWAPPKIERNSEILRLEQAAITTRASPSFLRVGQIELHARVKSTAAYRRLLAYALYRDFREHLIESEVTVSKIDEILQTEMGSSRIDFQSMHIDTLIPTPLINQLLTLPNLKRMVEVFAHRQARLHAEWLRVGYIHGNMNNDNALLCGYTMDYGPFGFLEEFSENGQIWVGDPQGQNYGFLKQPLAGKVILTTFVRRIERNLFDAKTGTQSDASEGDQDTSTDHGSESDKELDELDDDEDGEDSENRQYKGTPEQQEFKRDLAKFADSISEIYMEKIFQPFNVEILRKRLGFKTTPGIGGSSPLNPLGSLSNISAHPKSAKAHLDDLLKNNSTQDYIDLVYRGRSGAGKSTTTEDSNAVFSKEILALTRNLQDTMESERLDYIFTWRALTDVVFNNTCDYPDDNTSHYSAKFYNSIEKVSKTIASNSMPPIALDIGCLFSPEPFQRALPMMTPNGRPEKTKRFAFSVKSDPVEGTKPNANIENYKPCNEIEGEGKCNTDSGLSTAANKSRTNTPPDRDLQPLPMKLKKWLLRWVEVLFRVHIDIPPAKSRQLLPEESRLIMKQTSPQIIPRNWLLVMAYEGAEHGNYTVAKELQELSMNPYMDIPNPNHPYVRRAPPWTHAKAGVRYMS